MRLATVLHADGQRMAVLSGENVPVPPGWQQPDFELEVAVVVGASGHDLDPVSAHDSVFGYCILDDWSARDLQRRERQVNLGPAKGKDSSATRGPWIVTADEFVDRHDADGDAPIHHRYSPVMWWR
ncbi:2-keto-4-pentenoate hydratase/2-oxohepta-3-ene-1,7-dioic acid hydratase in catechol pathway [Nakamurella sp. UYEF19]|uniref:fumarylacetoacetate hydrolase family protein n=1 Tax=Nakamurella sp. UYEF19 TaxID=1756392 RepID=UPI003396739C